MTQFLAVANRKGGVGKSTVAVMLAHAFAIWGKKRVLLVDLNSQCNASLILMGGEAWNTARRANQTVADYLYDMFDGNEAEPKDYVIAGAGDVRDDSGKTARIWLLPGSVLLEDVQGELFLKEAAHGNDPEVIGQRVRGKLERLLKRFARAYDLVIFDCAPGISFAALSALSSANRVLVPFRPDYVSQFAVERLAMLVENKRNAADLEEVPLERRRYLCLANFVRPRGPDRVILEEMASFHPMLRTQLHHSDALANAFYWDPRPKRIAEKYGDAVHDMRKLYDELTSYVPT